MKLLPGFPCIQAPLFHFPIDWSRRLLLGAGVEEREGCFFPIPSWRTPTDEELAQLVGAASASMSPGEVQSSLCLFKLPEHLFAGWWNLLEEVGDLTVGGLPGLDAFVREVGEFLSFKRLPTPEGAVFDLVVCKPGERSIRVDSQTGQLSGLGVDGPSGGPWPLAADDHRSRWWGGIHLGTETSAVVYLNLTAQQMHTELTQRFPGSPAPSTVADLATRFLRAFPEYPAVQLKMEPGEGWKLPTGGVQVDGYTQDKEDPDLLLLTRSK